MRCLIGLSELWALALDGTAERIDGLKVILESPLLLDF
jgi:hypothetical protein